MKKASVAALLLLALAACSSKKAQPASDTATAPHIQETASFNADSAYAYVERQVSFGPRVNNTQAHRNAGQWLAAELKRHGAQVELQPATLKAHDGTSLQALNILGRFNPEATDRLLILAHWDSRPWADKDPDPAKHSTPVDGANDGASGVGVILELARLLGQNPQPAGIDLLFVDAEDRGNYENDESWALGSRHYAANLPLDSLRPTRAILLDMVGAPGARFRREYFSEKAAPELARQIWATAEASGYGAYFLNEMGGMLTDDHVELIKKGIPAIDIIDFDPNTTTGFTPTWHTTKDNMSGISRATLKAVGQTLTNFIYSASTKAI